MAIFKSFKAMCLFLKVRKRHSLENSSESILQCISPWLFVVLLHLIAMTSNTLLKGKVIALDPSLVPSKALSACVKVRNCNT